MELNHAQRESIGFGFILGEMRPNSAWGRQLLRGATPYLPQEKDALLAELANIEKTLAFRPKFEAAYKRLEHLFIQVKDIRASIHHIETGVLDEVELFEVKRYLIQLDEMMPLFDEINAEAAYNGITFEDTRAAFTLLDPDGTGIATFHISQRWSATLTEIRSEKKQLEEALRALDEDDAGRPALEARRRQTVADEQAEEEKVRTRITGQLREFVPALLANANAIARLDVCLQKARLAERFDGVMPAIEDGPVVFEGMRNPMVQQRLEDEGKQFTPVSITLSPGATVITGANMGGKSVTLKTLALNVYLVQCGFYPFAGSCRIPLFGAMHLLSEDMEDTSRGLSSFGGEIVRFNEIAASLGKAPALVLMDEFARGTNPEEGAAIAQSVCAWLNGRTDTSVMTTHFDHVAGYAGAHYEVVGLKHANIPELAARLNAAPLGERVAMIARQMDYGLVPVEPGAEMPHDALNICRLLGLNDNIVLEIEKKLLTFDTMRVE